jgi:hypothetical protein
MISQRTGPRSSVLNQVMSKTVDPGGRGYRATVGFNPFRDHDKSATDIAVMVIALIAILAVLAWAIF